MEIIEATEIVQGILLSRIRTEDGCMLQGMTLSLQEAAALITALQEFLERRSA